MSQYQHKWMFIIWKKTKCKRLDRLVSMNAIWMSSKVICILR